ncbi:PHP domain-containing protein [Candidatus Micrarchaeota archaeon]|nr:PHP domain-containing protein [Candidatus Micrarchaeota archaeon]MBU1930952.1 PHP domain-containing protein [Candidatus Micrarchaeota archaeon]
MKADLHVHSKYSKDALTSPRSFVKSAQKKGLQAIALTDHNTIKGWKPVLEAARGSSVQVILGAEIKVLENQKTSGEILGLFLNEAIASGPVEMVLDAIKQQGGIAIIAHPFDGVRHSFKNLETIAKKVDAIEVLNARVFSEKANQKALAFAQKNELVGTAGSDAHTPIEIGRAFVESPAANLEELQKNIRKGKIVVKGKRSSVWVHVCSTLAKTRLLPSW